MRGRATLTTVESRKTIPEPSTAAARIQRLVVIRLILLFSYETTAASSKRADEADENERRHNGPCSGHRRNAVVGQPRDGAARDCRRGRVVGGIRICRCGDSAGC